MNGTWDFARFVGADGETDWDAVLDAEQARRALLAATPVAVPDVTVSGDADVVDFDTNMVPWWVWVKRYHLPVAEKVNGRAAMLGYFLGLLVDRASGVGLAEQQDSFLGGALLYLTIFGCLFIRETAQVKTLQGLLDEATFYDRQWNASWDGVERPDVN